MKMLYSRTEHFPEQYLSVFDFEGVSYNSGNDLFISSILGILKLAISVNLYLVKHCYLTTVACLLQHQYVSL